MEDVIHLIKGEGDVTVLFVFFLSKEFLKLSEKNKQKHPPLHANQSSTMHSK
jgi:hypothetical protein